jgi:hypothetical protein
LECTWTREEPPSNIIEPIPILDSDSPLQELVAGHAASDSVVGFVEESNIITWSDTMGFFMSPNRASLLTPESGILLTHYIMETGPLMATTPPAKNPALSTILPMAYVDDLVMNCVMMVGGTHLCYKDPEKLEFQTATRRHYACVLRGLRTALHNLQPTNTGKVLRILVVLILMANYEVRRFFE